MRKKDGFTLVELLVVIAIVAILIAMLYPVFVRASFKAYKMPCMASLKEIGQALLVYAADNNLYLPPSLSAIPLSADFGCPKAGTDEGLGIGLLPPRSFPKQGLGNSVVAAEAKFDLIASFSEMPYNRHGDYSTGVAFADGSAKSLTINSDWDHLRFGDLECPSREFTRWILQHRELSPK